MIPGLASRQAAYDAAEPDNTDVCEGCEDYDCIECTADCCRGCTAPPCGGCGAYSQACPHCGPDSD